MDNKTLLATTIGNGVVTAVKQTCLPPEAVKQLALLNDPDAKAAFRARYSLTLVLDWSDMSVKQITDAASANSSLVVASQTLIRDFVQQFVDGADVTELVKPHAGYLTFDAETRTVTVKVLNWTSRPKSRGTTSGEKLVTAAVAMSDAEFDALATARAKRRSKLDAASSIATDAARGAVKHKAKQS